MKATGVLLVILGSLSVLVSGLLVPIFGDGTTPSPVQNIISAMMIIGGLLVWSLQQIREVLLEDQRTRLEELQIEAAADDEVPT